MRAFNEEDLMGKYTQCFYRRLTHPSRGDSYIVWRRGTGDNVELLHLYSIGDGWGLRLLCQMLEVLQHTPPYATVFGFTRAGNAKARAFYERTGFTLTEVAGVYDEGRAVVFSARYDELCRLHLRNADNV